MNLETQTLDTIKDDLHCGRITLAQANVQMVRAERVRLITNSVPRDVRKALNDAVKRGELGHVAKDGDKPEAYFHPTFEYMVPGERNEYADRKARDTAAALLRTMVRMSDLHPATNPTPAKE